MSKSNNNLTMIVIIVVALIIFAVKYFLSDCRNIFGIPVTCRDALCDCEKTCKNDSNEICKFPHSKFCCKHIACKNNKYCQS